MKNLLWIVLLILFNSCNNERKKLNANFKEFLYAQNNIRGGFCLKFKGNDTLYIQKTIPDFDQEYSFSILNNTDKDSLISKINGLELKTNSRYIDNKIEDGITQVFALHKQKQTKSIYIHGRTGPKNIRNLGIWLKIFVDRQNFFKIQNPKPWRWHLENLAPPPPPPPKINVKKTTTATNRA